MGTMGETLEFAELTFPELDALDRSRTLFLQALSPLEIHGPHLPLGTDVFIAEEVRDRAMRRLQGLHPELTQVIMPSTYFGSDTIPGSVNVNGIALNLLLKDEGAMLAAMGFKYLLLTDNHGGPRHQIAIAKAVRSLHRRYGFHLIAPFLSFYRKMIELEPQLLAKTGTGPGSTGDVADIHAGLNETSLMLASANPRIRPNWRELPATSISPKRLPALLMRGLGAAAGTLGGRELGRDLAYLGQLLSWTTQPEMPTYIGAPSHATAEAGERVLEAFCDEAVELTQQALAGRAPFAHPLCWTLRFAQPTL